MQVQDLGAIDGPLMLIGGAYSNLPALQAALGEAARLGLGDGQILHTGDIVAYCADPQACVDLIAARGIRGIRGNVEESLAGGADDCGCGFADGSTCDLLSRGWYPYAQARVDARARAWMAGLPERIVFSHYRRRVVMLHGGARNVAEFIWPDAPDTVFEAEIAASGGADIVIAGHCGLAFQRQIGATLWLNAGVIGMPPNDGGVQTRYALLGKDGAQILALDYDHQAAAAAMRAVGLVQGYDRALISGYWPSEDILPPGLRRAA